MQTRRFPSSSGCAAKPVRTGIPLPLLGLVLIAMAPPLEVPCAAAGSPRERVSFNAGWRFARFGAMPDGSQREEPGAPPRTIAASSEESGRGNSADKALDGDSQTRWCAADGGENQWLKLDLGRPCQIGAIEVEWENNLAYQFRIEGSTDGQKWKTLADQTQNREAAAQNKASVAGDVRFVRVTVTHVPDNKWASIRELRVRDQAGALIRPAPPAAATALSPDSPQFSDADWRKLNLPHDWGIEGPFKQEYPGETGKLPWWGIGWYRKHFTVPASDAGRQLYLDVDGAMSHAQVWLNGALVGGWPYGYASWRVDLTPHLKVGGENLLAIRLDNPPDSSRWYPGGGIYRNVWLVKVDPVHVAHWGVFVATEAVNENQATLAIAITVENCWSGEASVRTETDIYPLDALGRRSAQPVARLGVSKQATAISAGASVTRRSELTVPSPKLWSIKTPNLYAAVTSVEQNGKVVDEVVTPFGIRTAQFTVENGFLLNGKRVPLNGVCNHHDLGALGAALNTRALERQLQILKDMGCNAIRTSHNPPAPELLDLCDRMGFVVMDEAFDCWKSGKKPNDYHRDFPQWHEKDVRALVQRDRNHPCVVLWSIGNEISEQGSPAGHQIAAELAAIVRSEDTTRPVTAGCNDTRAGYNGFQKTVDVFGYNYKPREYPKVRQANPALPLYGSETASCVSSRGEYFFPVSEDKGKGKADFQMSSYDLYAPPWATPPDWEFKGQDESPFVAGEFVWTGFDYLGEPTPYNADVSNLLNFTDPVEKARLEKQLQELGRIRVPSRSSYFGIIDLAGFPKDRFYLYQARWRPELPMAHILPHWNWPERVGEITPIHVYSSGDEVELFLNGKSLGRKARGKLEYRFRWDDVVYQTGQVKAVAYKAGKKWAEDTVKTTGPATRLVLKVDRKEIKADGTDLAFVTLAVADRDGMTVPRAKQRIRFSLSGPGEIVATDNGDATSHESFQSPERNAYNGLALAIVRSRPGQTGKLTLRAESGGLKAGEITFRAVRGE